MELAQVEKISKTLADATRLKIPYYIAGQTDHCAQLGIVNGQPMQPSDYIKTLLEADLVTPGKEDRNHLVNRMGQITMQNSSGR